jgi:hypothetical protein
MPPRRTPPSPRLQELRALASEPAAQAALAQSILATDKDVQAIRAAVEALKAHPTPAARPVLRERFEHYAADGVRRDAGGYLRAAILQALRPIALPADLPLLERAAATYEFLPPGRSEEGSLLRSAALVTLDAVDPTLATYHSIRLLADKHTSRLSGEPAVTAVRVLAAQGNAWPVYYYALHQPNPQSDVLSECLKNLAGLPAALAAELIEKYGSSDDEVVLVGLLDMVLDSGGGPFIHKFLAETKKYAVYHYLVTRLVAAPTPAALAELGQLAQRERNARKLGILAEALALGRAHPLTETALSAVRRSQKLAAQARAEEARDSDDRETG